MPKGLTPPVPVCLPSSSSVIGASAQLIHPQPSTSAVVASAAVASASPMVKSDVGATMKNPKASIPSMSFDINDPQSDPPIPEAKKNEKPKKGGLQVYSSVDSVSRFEILAVTCSIMGGRLEPRE